MTTLYLRSDKKLIVLKESDHFRGENIFETVKIISAEEISGHKLKECIVEAHIINPKREGDIIQLAFLGKTDGKPSAEFLLSKKYTAIDGDLRIFLKIFAGEAIGLTNEAVVRVKSHKAATTYIADSQLTLLDQYSATFQKAKKLLDEGGIHVSDDKIENYIYNYLDTHQLIEELTEEDVKNLFIMEE